MKVLLDENIDVRFKYRFNPGEHQVFTVKDMKWNGLKNGLLLQNLESEGFDVLISVDKNMEFQQNRYKLPVTIFVLDVPKNILSELEIFVPILLAAWQNPLEKGIFILKIDNRNPS